MRWSQDGVESDNNSGVDWRKYFRLETNDNDENDDYENNQVAESAEASRGDMTDRWTAPSTVAITEERRSSDGTTTDKDNDRRQRTDVVDTVVPSSTRSLSSPSLSQRDSASSGAVWATASASRDDAQRRENDNKWSVLKRTHALINRYKCKKLTSLKLSVRTT